MTKFLKTAGELKLPENYPQSKQVVEEQLNVLRSLQGIPQPQSVPKTNPEPSSSSANSPYKKMEKTTSFVPNSQTKQGSSKGMLMIDRLKAAEPYNLFFTKIPESRETHKQPNSISLPDLLCPSLGELESSLQMNFMIDIMWLMEQYEIQGVE